MVQPSSTTINPSENGLHGLKKPGDNRRSNKPIMEKRRRARINNCLNELKTLILDAMKKDPARHSKLEKADILEMTVRHLQNLQSQQVAMSASTDPNVLNKFRAGFSECVTEVGRFSGLDPTVRRRLMQHLTNCLNQNQKSQEVAQVQVHILPNNGATMEQHANGIILSNGQVGGVQLVPTRLPNGDLALVLPASAGQTHTRTTNSSPLPLLVPIPQRTSSTHSASSGSSNYSLSTSPEPSVDHCYQPRPLSLVMRKREQPTGDKPWRPW